MLTATLDQLLACFTALDTRLSAIESRLPPPPPAPKPPLLLDGTLITSFLRWSSRDKRNSKAWARRQRTYLEWWAEQLDGRNLRQLEIAEHVVPPLDGAPSRTHRLAVIKCLFTWLWKVRHQVTAAEATRLDELPLPQSIPAQDTMVKAISRKHYLAVRPYLKQRWRDALDILAATGWHCSELERFVRGGEVQKGVLVCPWAKRGGVLRTRASRKTLAAGSRLLQRRTWSEKAFRMAIADGCEDARKALILPGRLRHSVATFAHDHGDALQSIADFFHHRSKVTTVRFYVAFAKPKKIRNLADG